MPKENKVYYRTLPFHAEPIEFYNEEGQAKYEADQYGRQTVREISFAGALNLLLEKIRFLENQIG